MSYLKLTDGVTFTVKEAGTYQWKKWDSANSKMLTSDTYQDGFSKKYAITTDKGTLDASSDQLRQMLEGGYSNGTSNIIGLTYSVKTNGKTGIEIRYYINPIREVKTQPVADTELRDDLPF